MPEDLTAPGQLQTPIGKLHDLHHRTGARRMRLTRLDLQEGALETAHTLPACAAPVMQRADARELVP